jgi:arginine deiminase
MKTLINSEIGKLEGVIIHTPGHEVENMIPENAERALYSDILNLSIASQEYSQLSGVLKKITHIYEVKKMLTDIMDNKVTKMQLLHDICFNEGISGMEEYLADNSTPDLAELLIEGVPLERNNLTNYLSKEKFLLRPLHNMFFTRDPAMGMNSKMLIGRMANPVRERETIIMEAILKHHTDFETSTINPIKPLRGIPLDKKATLEGGDLQVIREDIYVIGTGIRTSTQGIDFIIENIKSQKKDAHHIIVQELPSTPESFIHLDMVFTCIDVDTCIVYEPVIHRLSPYRTIYILIENGKVIIKERANIPEALKKLGIDLKPLRCGGKNDPWIQEREQWHSGANFLALSPGKIIGYERNMYTLEELNNNGYEIQKASEIITGKASVDDHKKCVITMAGSELARGGGGARCMTMPVKRKKVNW